MAGRAIPDRLGKLLDGQNLNDADGLRTSVGSLSRDSGGDRRRRRDLRPADGPADPHSGPGPGDDPAERS